MNPVKCSLVDELFMKYLSDLALREDDYLLGQVFYSYRDSRRKSPRTWQEDR